MKLPPRRPKQTEHELDIATLFVQHLASYEEIVAVDLRPGNQAIDEPDCMCSVNGAARGIELVDCWPSGARASWTWTARMVGFDSSGLLSLVGPVDPRFLEEGDVTQDLFIRIAERLMRETWKAYVPPTWLILNASQMIIPWHDARSGPSLVGQIRKPAGYPFKDVYLCLAPASWSTDPRQFYRVS
jgi:hypothetical protein